MARPNNTLRRCIYGEKSKSTPNDNQQSLVYQYTCECGKVYFGKTKRRLTDRIAEHRRLITTRKIGICELADHILNSGHGFEPSRFKAIDSSHSDYGLWIREGYYIQKGGNHVLNKSESRLAFGWFT